MYKTTFDLVKQWERVPELRFGQLMSNLIGYSKKDIFFLEEKDFLELIEKYFDIINNLNEI